VISYGGGVQSTALVVLAATHDPAFEAAVGGPVDAALFCNVGDDSEHPAALEWVRDVVTPWAAERGFPVHELDRVRRDGTTETLMGRMVREGSKSLPIPVRGSETGAPGKRSCTADFKIAVIGKWLKANGASRDSRADVCIGISTDEIQRAGRQVVEPHLVRLYPLIALGLDRSACQQINVDTFGRPAPKSSCFFCPFHRPAVWAEMRRDEPDLFARSAALEATLNERRIDRGMSPVYLTRFGKPLDEAIPEAQTPLFAGDGHDIGEAGCDEGVCFV
jgi:hypothetical protein